MSLFKKKNRNIRKREIETEDDEENTGPLGNNMIKPSEKVSEAKSRIKQSLLSFSTDLGENQYDQNTVPSQKSKTLLSFGEELDEGEVFQVKKSSHSRKLKKMLNKEREEKKKRERKESPKKSDPMANAEHELTIKIKNPISGTGVGIILNGSSAEMAGYRSDSEAEEEESNLPRHTFSQPDQVKMLLRNGQIPDANLIHAARKKRQQAREMGITYAGYTPQETVNLDADSVEKKVDHSKSRLMREENEVSDEDEVIQMSGIVSSKADREKRIEDLDNYISSGAEEDRFDDEEWETQQIRKAVSEAQLAEAQQELYQMQRVNTIPIGGTAGFPLPYVPGLVPSDSLPIIPPVLPSSVCCGMFQQPLSVPSSSTYQQPLFVPVSECNEPPTTDPEQIMQKLRSRLEKLTESYSKRNVDQETLSSQLSSLQGDQERRQGSVPSLADRFRFYQDFRRYVSDLVECLDEKLPLIDSLEQRLLNIYRKKATDLINRRRQDVKDQVEELTPNSRVAKRDEDHIRRTAEREGRRIRRSKQRTLIECHIDGMSSDDEVTEMVSSAYKSQRDVIEADAQKVFEDVVDEFVSVDSVLDRFLEWRKRDKTAYVEAYANICLPKALAPLIRMNMLMWDPLNKDDEVVVFENQNWVRSVMMYAAEVNDTVESLYTDPDINLLPKLIERVVTSKLEQIVEAQWDPLSSSETQKLTSLIRLISEYPIVSHNSKAFMKLLDTVVKKINSCIENDVFIPMFNRNVTDPGKLNAFFQRQFAMTLKLFGNILKWHGIVSESVLSDLALSALLNRYLLMAIRTMPFSDAAAKCLLISRYLPISWLRSLETCPAQLSQFLTYVKELVPKLDLTQPNLRGTAEKLKDLTRYV